AEIRRLLAADKRSPHTDQLHRITGTAQYGTAPLAARGPAARLDSGASPRGPAGAPRPLGSAPAAPALEVGEEPSGFESRRVAPEPSGAEGAAEPRPEGPEPRPEGTEPRPEGPEPRPEGPEPRRRFAPPVPGEPRLTAAARRPSSRPAPRSSSSRAAARA